MFSTWQKEKATAALVDAAQAVADKLDAAKPHVRDGQAAAAWVWAARLMSEGQDVADVAQWTPAAVARFVSASATRIAALRKARDYDSSDGLAVWLHTARSVTEPRIAPAARAIWRHLSAAGQNADTMAAEMLVEAGLPAAHTRMIPKGYETADEA